jgi:hypothetical protein
MDYGEESLVLRRQPLDNDNDHWQFLAGGTVVGERTFRAGSSATLAFRQILTKLLRD